jgi:hypothetical protein
MHKFLQSIQLNPVGKRHNVRPGLARLNLVLPVGLLLPLVGSWRGS